jgi:hypothetical protein
MRKPIDRPNLLWRGFALGGVTTMAVLSTSDEAWNWWEHNVTDAIPRTAIRATLGVTVAIHIGEALVARRRSRQAGLEHSGAWARTALIYGFPALGRLKKQIRHLEGAVDAADLALDELQAVVEAA